MTTAAPSGSRTTSRRGSRFIIEVPAVAGKAARLEEVTA